MNIKLEISAAALCTWFAATAAMAQPAVFAEIGPITVPATPSTFQDIIDTPTAFDLGDGINPGETLTVKWLRFDLVNTVSGDLFIDMSGGLFDATKDLTLALYDASGSLVSAGLTFNGRGSFGSSLSFGSSAERPTSAFNFMSGQSGPSLAAGEYWLAVAAGTPAEVTIGATAWDVQTTAAYVLGYSETTTFVDVAFAVGNTTPLPPPFNNDCSNPAEIGEDVGTTPAFVGSLDGATQDGISPCWTNIPNVTYKDVWVNYTPTVTGWVQVVASGTNSPILTMFSGCGGFVERCSGGGNFALVGGARIGFFATAGQPVLFSIAGRGGLTGAIRVNIDPFGPPCTLNVPPGATVESEACGTTENDGCGGPGEPSTTIAPNESILGTLFTTTNPAIRDRDWYTLNITEPSTVTLSVSGQVAVESVILAPPITPGECGNGQVLLARTSNFATPCVPATSTVVLLPGAYRVAVAQLFSDGMACGSGYENYVLSISSTPCEQPVVVSEPTDATAGPRCTVTYTGSMAGSTDVAYTWQWGQIVPETDPPFVYWSDLQDGEFYENFSTAQISGANTDTLTISNIDNAMLAITPQLRFRLKGEVCAPNYTAEALFTPLPTICDPCNYDYNQDENVDLTDAQLMAQVAAGIITAEFEWLSGDLNLDENADLTDAQLLATFVATGVCGV